MHNRGPKGKAAKRSNTEGATPNVPGSDESALLENIDFSKFAHSSPPSQSAILGLPKRKKRYTWLVFTIGGIAGLLLAGAAAKNQDMISMELLRDLSLDSIIDVIPVGILKEANDISHRDKDAVSYDAFSTGLALKAAGLEAVHPVVMVPGVISTGLVDSGGAEGWWESVC